MIGDAVLFTELEIHETWDFLFWQLKVTQKLHLGTSRKLKVTDYFFTIQ